MLSAARWHFSVVAEIVVGCDERRRWFNGNFPAYLTLANIEKLKTNEGFVSSFKCDATLLLPSVFDGGERTLRRVAQSHLNDAFS